ncbi:Putative sugar transferase (fragment) [Methylorubrum extorquens]|uniref:Sugar transferase n=1 Tax=Methylorubrum extorquens TaxID=408 RepID=A0A2N9AHV3_METEX
MTGNAVPRPAPSVLTLVRGRADRLRNLMRGLARQTLRPRELVIAWMQPEPAPDLPDPGCPVCHLHVPGEPMPLAAARNRAAAAASGNLLVFLDVDCIPGPTLVAAYADAAAAERGPVPRRSPLPAAGCDRGRHGPRSRRARPARPRSSGAASPARDRAAARARCGAALGPVLRPARRGVARGRRHG